MEVTEPTASIVSAPDPTDAAADGLHHRYASRPFQYIEKLDIRPPPVMKLTT